jgi:ferric-dicitrate binding protein FerR (iron transport regulator)
MVMTNSKRDDLIWRTAVDWIVREHEGPLDDTARKALVAWLKGDPAHRSAYDEAARLWLLTGLVPPSGGDGDSPPSLPGE